MTFISAGPMTSFGAGMGLGIVVEGGVLAEDLITSRSAACDKRGRRGSGLGPWWSAFLRIGH